jgi:short-subunit dehydrogenase
VNIEAWIKKSFDLEKDSVLITGASSGIGYEYLKVFTAIGCKCIATSNESAELDACMQKLDSSSASRVRLVTGDLATSAGLCHLIESVKLDRIGVLVNCAGFGLKGGFADIDPQRYSEIIHLNSVAPTLLTRAVLPGMIEAARGLIVHVASVNAVTPVSYSAVYSATKAYILHYAYALAYELRSTPILSHIVLPGTTNTPFHVKQGAVPSSMCMQPNEVVKRSLSRVDAIIHVSNKLDRFLFPLVASLPYFLRIRFAAYLFKKRLKIRS